MAPPRPSVTSVALDARANNPSQRPFATPSAPLVANVSAHDDIDHNQDALSEVPPPSKPSVATSSPPLRQTPEQRRRHVIPGVVRVPFDEAAARENIQKMRTNTWGLLGKWPLSSLFGLFGALPAKVGPSAAEEERPEEDTPPPPYTSEQQVSEGT